MRPDAGARNELVRRYTPAAERLALRYRSPHEPQEDLNQVARMALIGAVDRFDPTRGIPFLGFAVPTILGELKKYFRGTAWALHVPRAAAERAQAARRAEVQLTDRLGRSPTVSELAECLGLDLAATVEALEADAARHAVSLDAPIAGDDGEPAGLIALLGGEDHNYGVVDLHLSLGPALGSLPFLERRALQLRTADQLNQAEIGERLGCSQMQVSRLLSRAKGRIRAQMEGVAYAEGT